MPSQPRLAFLTTHTSPLARPGTVKAGGMNVYIRELTRELGARGYAVDIFTRRDQRDTAPVVPLAENVRLVNLPAGPAQPLAPDAVHPLLTAFTAALRRFVADEELTYDLIHSHYWISGLAGIALAKAWRCPLIAMFHTLGQVKNRARRGEHASPVRIAGEHRIVQAAARLICATPHERDLLVSLYGAAADSVRVVPGGVALAQFRPGNTAAARARLGLSGGPIALFVGRLEPLKGVDILLRAAAIADLDQPLTVIIAGVDGPDRHERRRLDALIAELGIGARVRFVGAVEREQLPAYYQAADVCVVPSYYESFGLVAVEALASGTPVIATRVGGLQYTVRDGQTGYLIPWRCPEPFAERLEALLLNNDLHRRFRRAARPSVERFDWRIVASGIADIYEELLAASATQPFGAAQHGAPSAARRAACYHPS